jgi:hypothetical protein
MLSDGFARSSELIANLDISSVSDGVLEKVGRLARGMPLAFANYYGVHSAPPSHCQSFLPMRLIVGISLVLFGVGSMLCEVEWHSGVTPAASGLTGRVRTTDGWESPLNWRTESASPPRVHPLVVAAGQGLVSIFALVACHNERRPQRDTAHA